MQPSVAHNVTAVVPCYIGSLAPRLAHHLMTGTDEASVVWCQCLGWLLALRADRLCDVASSWRASRKDESCSIPKESAAPVRDARSLQTTTFSKSHGPATSEQRLLLA